MRTEELEIILNKPHQAQREILEGKKRFNVLACGRRFGKSKLAVNLLVEPALEGWPTGYFTPTYKLLEGVYNDCLHACANIISRKHDNQKIELISGGIIEFWSLDNQLAGRSRKYKRAVCDEIAFARNFWESWTEAIRPTLTDLKGDAWFMSTPKGKNDFHKLFMRGRSGEENWASWQMPTSANPYIDPSELEDARQDLPALAFSQEYLAEFNENVANPFGAAFIKLCTFPMSMEPAVCFGIDLAKSFDWSVIIGLDKYGQVCHFDRWQGDWQTTKRKILDLPRNTRIRIDSTGVGDPIGEDIARVRSVNLFKFTSISKQQLMEGLAAAIQQRKVTFPEGIITDELYNFEYEYTRTGVKYSAPAGLHDDCVCALALAVAEHSTAAGFGHYSIA